jgi:polar amino acid transport system substrate-binding protein
MNLNRCFALTCILFLSLVSAWGDPTNALPAGPAPLKVGVTPSFPPMVYKDGETLAGMEIDFAKALGKELGRPVQFVEVEWQDQIPALADGRTDIIMSTMSVTLARQLRVSFANPYLVIGQTVLVRREDAGKFVFGFPVEPQGTVGVLKATTGDYLVQQEFPRARRKAFNSPQDAAKALVRKKIDMVICDSPTAWWLAGEHEAEGLTVVPIALSHENLAWAVRKSDTELLASVNNALDKFNANGIANAIIKRWLPLFQ